MLGSYANHCKYKCVSIITATHVKMGTEPNPETFCVSNILPKMDNLQHCIGIKLLLLLLLLLLFRYIECAKKVRLG
jgi:hypothetical protein